MHRLPSCITTPPYLEGLALLQTGEQILLPTNPGPAGSLKSQTPGLAHTCVHVCVYMCVCICLCVPVRVCDCSRPHSSLSSRQKTKGPMCVQMRLPFVIPHNQQLIMSLQGVPCGHTVTRGVAKQ